MTRSPTVVLAKIARALPPFERTYALARFLVLRPRLLSVMDAMLPSDGPLLDLGCGFGLWTAYFGAMQPRRRITGVDLSGRRVELARRVSRQLGVDASFVCGDVRDATLAHGCAGAYMLDVLHHLPREAQVPMLARVRDALLPGGVLVLKDITTEPYLGLKFTELLDRAMVGMDAPLAYRHHDDWARVLGELGFAVRIVRVPDVLPYPHVVLAATKR